MRQLVGDVRALDHVVALGERLVRVAEQALDLQVALLSLSSWTSGAPGCIASSMSKTAGSGSYSTLMSESASSAVSSSTAATAATSSPT